MRCRVPGEVSGKRLGRGACPPYECYLSPCVRVASPVATWHVSCGLVRTGGGLRADVKRLARYARRCPRLFLAAMAASRPSPPRRLASDLGNA